MKTSLNTNRPLRTSLRTLLAGVVVTAGALCLAAATSATATAAVIDDFSQGQTGLPATLNDNDTYSQTDNVPGVWGGTRTVVGEVTGSPTGRIDLKIDSQMFHADEH